jgi:catechol 2,3-dioxygenase-like lactoylglutathione lyase family enzyme
VTYRYVALFVHDLRAAESFYRQVFGMGLLFREGKLAGEWGTLPLDKGWEDAEAAGVELGMLALARDDIVLPLFQGTPSPGTVLEICLGFTNEEIESVRSRLTADVTIREHEEGFLHFDDPFGYRWTLQPHEIPFLSNGEHSGRWLEV